MTTQTSASEKVLQHTLSQVRSVVCFCAVVCVESLWGVPRDLASVYVLYQEAPPSYKHLSKVSAEAPQDFGTCRGFLCVWFAFVQSSVKSLRGKSRETCRLYIRFTINNNNNNTHLLV